jgi:putative membrane protein
MTEQGDPGRAPSSAAQAVTDVAQRTGMAAERTWLAWWRTALAATAGSLGVGRLAPELLDVASWPYVVLGMTYAGLAIGLLMMGARRQRQLQQALHLDVPAPLRFPVVAVFTAGGVVLVLLTIVLVVAQT